MVYKSMFTILDLIEEVEVQSQSDPLHPDSVLTGNY